MINIEYTMSSQETADATLNFLVNRPLFTFLFLLMRYSCILLCFGFIITLYQKNTRPEDYAAVVMAFIWLFYYKKINRWIIKSTLKGRKFETMQRTFKIDEKSIFCRTAKAEPINIEWKKLKYILKTTDGYIVPLTGITNAGKFFWLPFRAFQEQNEQQFLDLANKFKLNVKAI